MRLQPLCHKGSGVREKILFYIRKKRKSSDTTKRGESRSVNIVIASFIYSLLLVFNNYSHLTHTNVKQV